MNPRDVQLVGSVAAGGMPFCYSVNAPTNLWVSGRVRGGGVVHVTGLGSVLNLLIEADRFDEAEFVEFVDEAGATYRATVRRPILRRLVEANLAQTDVVTIVEISRVRGDT